MKSCNYPISPGGDCIGRDTRTVLGEFSMIWLWIALTVVFFFGFIISVIRDIIPRPKRSDTSDRYFTGESRNVVRFLIEEYLITGWMVSKTEKRFSNTARWALITTIIYTEMLITGALYERDYSNPSSFTSRDFVYGMVSTAITFFFYLVGYYLLVNRESDGKFSIRHLFGYIFTGIMTASCLIFVFVFTYQVHDDVNVNYTNLVDHWLSAFGYSILLEALVSENIRIITRAILIWSKKFNPEEALPTIMEMPSMDRRKDYEDDDY